MLGVLLIHTFYRISLSTPKTFFILWMVDGVCLNYDGIEHKQRTVLFFDIITDAAGRLEDYVHKGCTIDLCGTLSIQKNLKLEPHQPSITHKI